MALGPMLLLGGLLYAFTRKKGSVRVVSKSPDLPPLKVFTEDQVFGPPASAPQKEEQPVFVPQEGAVQPQEETVSLEQWAPAGSQSIPGEKHVVHPPPELDANQEQFVEQAPVALTPGQAAQAAADSPGLPVEEVAVADPATAARELADYVVANRGKGLRLGTKGSPSPAVKALQVQMGGIAADGIYGPATRARGAELGVTMPARK